VSTETLSLDAARDLARAALVACRTSEANATAVAAALVAAEADGLAGHGLSRVAAYADQAKSGKVDGFAVPAVARPRPGAVLVDAGMGFAFPALDAAVDAVAGIAPDQGVVAAAVANSHHFGVAGHHVEAVARRGLIGLLFGNSPAAIAPWGGATPLFGTNPIAFACPRTGAEPLVVDLSLSKVARGKIMVAAQKGEPMLPMGDAKGAALVLVVELLAVALTGSNFGWEASSFFTADGPAPRVGQLLIAIDPGAFGPSAVTERRIADLCGAVLGQRGARLPGDRRLALRVKAARDGIAVPAALVADMRRRAAGGCRPGPDGGNRSSLGHELEKIRAKRGDRRPVGPLARPVPGADGFMSGKSRFLVVAALLAMAMYYLF
jgi:(2R)-3-sulfolactate dehydrogenase (NADP+)